MSGLLAYVAGIPESAHALIQKGIDNGYGSGQTEIQNLDLTQPLSTMKLRESGKSNAVIAVLFGDGAYERGQKIEKGLYGTEKFHHYKDDRSLVLYLNEVHGADLEVPEEAPVSVTLSYGDVDKGSVDTFNEVSTDPVGISEGYRSDGALILENRELHNLNSVLQRQLDEAYTAPEENNNSEELQKSHKRIKELESIIAQYKTHAGALNKKQQEDASNISTLTRTLEEKERTVASQGIKISELTGQTAELPRLRADLERIRGEAGMYKDASDAANESVRTLTQVNAGLSQTVSNMREQVTGTEGHEQEIRRLTGINDDTIAEKNKIEENLGKAKQLIEDYKKHEEETDALFETEKKAALDALRESFEAQLQAKDLIIQDYINSSNEPVVETVQEMSSGDIEKIAKFENSVFGGVADTAMPRQAPPALEIGNRRYQNISFVFSATRVSSDDTMRSILNLSNTIASSCRAGVVVLDISNETSTDYIFGGDVTTQGVRWAEGTLDLDQVISKPSIGNSPSGNVRFLSLGGASFINDAYLLTIDWATRLRELENSGYKIIIYAGCLSELVGRILYRSFAGTAQTRIYAKGNLVSMRSAYYTLSTMPYYETTTLHVFDLIRSKTSQAVISRLAEAKFNPVIDSVVKRKETNA